MRGTGVAIVLAVLTGGCRPFGCDTDQCVREAPYARLLHCASIYQAGATALRDPAARGKLRGAPNALQAKAMDAVNGALKEGRSLGLRREAVYQALERERLAYLDPLQSRSVPDQSYDKLVTDISRCDDGEDL